MGARNLEAVQQITFLEAEERGFPRASAPDPAVLMPADPREVLPHRGQQEALVP